MKSSHCIFTVSLLSIMVLAVVGSGIAMALKRFGSDLRPPSPVYTRRGELSQSSLSKLALKEINDAGGVNGEKIDLRIIDSQSSNPGALASLQKAVEQENVAGPDWLPL